MVLPYNDSLMGKKQQVRAMFNNIASSYDLLNHILSFNIDRMWRRKAIDMLRELSPQNILDVATGTGDFAIESLRLHPARVTGTDISEAMLEEGKRKVQNKKLTDRIGFVWGDAENLPFEGESFDAVISGFGVRNFEDTEKGISEMFRVLRRGGQVVLLEFSKPQNPFFRRLYRIYFTKVLPAVGRMVSKDQSAYRYLPDSVREFPEREAFLELLEAAGFEKCRFASLTWGIAANYTGLKPHR